MTQDQRPLRESAIDEPTLRLIFEADQEIYPAPLSFSRLQAWSVARPDLFIAFHDSGTPTLLGVILVLPLRRATWERLLTGALKEHEIEPTSAFPPVGSDEIEVGLHVFHIERFRQSQPHVRFTEIAMKSVESVAKGVGWTVVGYSALTATEDGRRVFTRLGFSQTGYEEIFTISNDDATSGAQMHCIIPGQKNESECESGTNRVVVARSQMVVKLS